MVKAWVLVVADGDGNDGGGIGNAGDYSNEVHCVRNYVGLLFCYRSEIQ